jgi:putative ABC transport system permease protein
LDPVGRTIRIEEVAYRVSGVLCPKGAFFKEDQDQLILAPFSTLAHQWGLGEEAHVILACANSRERIGRAKQEIALAIRRSQGLAPFRPDSCKISDLGEMVEMVDKVVVAVTALLGAIGAVSLLVGGIGIMNILLVSVAERTREIGLRMALGASDRHLVFQFLAESAVLSGLGGLLGLLGGLGVAAFSLHILAVHFEQVWPMVIRPVSLAVALLFALLVGFIFGLYPALRAGRMDPIVALRET